MIASDGVSAAGLAWSFDGSRVAYVSIRTADQGASGTYWGIYSQAWNGEGSEEPLFRYVPGLPIEQLGGFTADERFLTFGSGGVVFVVPLTGPEPLARQAVEFAREEFPMDLARLSPDGRFMVYASEQSGRPELYVHPVDSSTAMTAAEGKWQITGHGPPIAWPMWRLDGREILYATGAAIAGGEGIAVIAVDVVTTPISQLPEPRVLFRLLAAPRASQFTNDGQRFVVAVPVSAAETIP